MLFILLLAVSVSLDTLGLSISYGIAGIRIPCKTRIFVALLNGGMTGLALWLGERFLTHVPKLWLSVAGGMILLILGVRALWMTLGGDGTTNYDRDRSRVIDLREGAALGFALALDSVSASFGIVGQGGYVCLFPVCTAFLCALFLWVGEVWIRPARYLNSLSGIVLILLGLCRLGAAFF
jgi:putative Mn2+ efflux pump MntP